MSLTSPRRIDAEQRLKELLEQFNDLQDTDKTLSELRESVKQYEERYGMASERIHEAIDAGELEEDLDVVHWIFRYELLCRVEAE
jgi:hypothetical protein